MHKTTGSTGRGSSATFCARIKLWWQVVGLIDEGKKHPHTKIRDPLRHAHGLVCTMTYVVCAQVKQPCQEPYSYSTWLIR